VSLDSSKSVKRAKTLFVYRVWFFVPGALQQARHKQLEAPTRLP